MDSHMFDGLIRDLLIFGIVIGFAIGGIAFFVVPWLWRLARPWLHAITG